MAWDLKRAWNEGHWYSNEAGMCFSSPYINWEEHRKSLLCLSDKPLWLSRAHLRSFFCSYRHLDDLTSAVSTRPPSPTMPINGFFWSQETPLPNLPPLPVHASVSLQTFHSFTPDTQEWHTLTFFRTLWKPTCSTSKLMCQTAEQSHHSAQCCYMFSLFTESALQTRGWSLWLGVFWGEDNV